MIIGCHDHPIGERQHALHLSVMNILLVRLDSGLRVNSDKMSLDHVNFVELLLRILVVRTNHAVQVRHLQHIGVDEIDLMKPNVNEMLGYDGSQSTYTNNRDDLDMHDYSYQVQAEYRCAD